MRLNGLKDLLWFVNELKERRVWYQLEHTRSQAITVAIHMPGIRLEVDFFDDHIEYGYFEGDESVFDDQGRLFELINERGK